MQSVAKPHPYEDPNYWSKRASAEGVATLGWSEQLNQFYYTIKEQHLQERLNRVPRSGSVLECGCGVGRIGQYIKTQRPDLTLVGSDFSREMLFAAAETNCYTSLVLAVITRLPFENASFDLVLAMDVLFHVVRPHKKGLAWCELARVARDETGIFAYGSGHEITSLVAMMQLVEALPFRFFGRRVQERVAMWLTKRCDGQR